MQLASLKAKSRKAGGKGPARQLRRDGAIPGVLYGGGGQPVTLAFNTREFEHLIHGRTGEHAIVQLDVEDDAALSSPALLKEVQHHPVRGSILHVDFQRIRLDERITTRVPIVLTGQAKGVVEGGVMDHQLREVEVQCLALEVPDSISVDVSNLGIGDTLHVAQLMAPENVTIVTDPDRNVVAVHAPRLLRAAAAEAAEAEPKEPEVIGAAAEKKEEEEGKEK